nr:hypothetical protein [Collinsella intestinalis]
MNIPYDRKQVAHVFNCSTRVSSLEQVARPTVPLVEVPCVHAAESLHEHTKVSFGIEQNDVHVIVHKTIRNHIDTLLLSKQLQAIEKEVSIHRILKNDLTTATANRHMV